MNSKSVALALSTTCLLACSDADHAAQEGNVTEGYATPVVVEYKLPAEIQLDVINDRETELWGRAFLPSRNGHLPALEPGRPLLLFVHGNGATCRDIAPITAPYCSPATGGTCFQNRGCDYTSLGFCGEGQTVAPNHRGFDYLARAMAQEGYVVVSINANRGITCGDEAAGDGGLIRARGRLVLKHLELLAAWNGSSTTGFPDTPFPLPFEGYTDDGNYLNNPTMLAALAGNLDLANVGLMGHSMGGEAMRAAYEQYHGTASAVDAGNFSLAEGTWAQKIGAVTFKGILEIAPSDALFCETNDCALDARGTSWATILPMCDGDLVHLPAMKHFDRTAAPHGFEDPGASKSMLAVWGAIHNYFNTEWPTPDFDLACTGPGHEPIWKSGNLHHGHGPDPLVDQQRIALEATRGFFLAHVGEGARPEHGQLFDPLHEMPPSIRDLTTYQRAYVDSSSSNDAIYLQEFDGSSAGWFDLPGGQARVDHVPEHDEVLLAASLSWPQRDPGAAPSTFEMQWPEVDVTAMSTLSFRVSRHETWEQPGPLDFAIVLVGAPDSGQVSEPRRLSTYATLHPPVGGGYLHHILQTVRIPLQDFTGVDLHRLAGIRLVFDEPSAGEIYLASVRAVRAR